MPAQNNSKKVPASFSIVSVVSICAGASLGALLRWLLAGRYNHLFPALPLGTLAANLIGGYLIGIAVAVFTHAPELSPQARLFVVTGFLGGLTTFSTFSAEVVTQLQQGHTAWALATALAHLLGSFALTALGIATVSWARS
jgi:fluoride exporter